MKNVHTTIGKVAAAAILSLGAGLSAADTQNMSVSATISPKCQFDTTATPTMAFGTAIDPSGTSNITAEASIVYKCTKGTSPSSLAPTSGGLSRTMANGSDTLAYTLVFDAVKPGTGFSTGKQQTIKVTGTITPAQFNDAVAVSYTESVSLTIAP
jgi:spore coat protein U-like protein